MALKRHKLTCAMQDLHAFLSLNWGDRDIPRAGRFDRRKAPTTDISTFTAVMSILAGALEGRDWNLASESVRQIDAFGEFLTSSRYAGHQKHLTNLTNAVSGRDLHRSNMHMFRLRKVVRRVAADRVFKDDERVSIIRTGHGWFDGSLSGRVKPGSGGHVVVADDGSEYDIVHLRDIH